ncbi:UNVERIFIED_CONTAM: hypothetical protein HDU68_001228 [Siphonaria sp. JEL0065]|nr:hypothetical protein HDU68_001228 [Siphonaria sp. JEL0065]
MQSTQFFHLPQHNKPFASDHYTVNQETQRVGPNRHWCFFAEIVDVSYVIRPRATVHLDFDETITIHFEPHSIDETPKTFSWETLVPGNTIAILYAQKKVMCDGMWGIKQQDLDSVCIFNAGAQMVSRYAEKIAETPSSCFHLECGKTRGLVECLHCGVALFCSAFHEKGGWKSGHRRLCHQSEEFKRMVKVLKAETRSDTFGSFSSDTNHDLGELVLKASQKSESKRNYEKLGLMPVGDDFIVDLSVDHLFPPAAE